VTASGVRTGAGPPARPCARAWRRRGAACMARLQGAWAGGRDVDARLAALEEVLLTADVGEGDAGAPRHTASRARALLSGSAGVRLARPHGGHSRV